MRIRTSLSVWTFSRIWSTALTIPKVLLSIFSLLTDPNPSHHLVFEIAQALLKDKSKHDNTARG